MTTDVGQRRWGTIAGWVAVALAWITLTTGLLLSAGARMPLSIVDEHVHLDYATSVHEGVWPYRGKLYGERVLEEWSCGVGHEAGDLTVPCGDPGVSADILPSGRYSTAYIHYPTYFVAGEGWRQVVEAVRGPVQHPLTTYRQAAALAMAVGVLACIVSAAVLGLRGSRLVLASTLPVAASTIVVMGTIVNPTSAAVLMGALIAGTTVHWIRSGRGFWLVAGAAALASATAVTHVLPVGGVILAALVAVGLAARGRPLPGPWAPRWWQPVLLAALVVVPVVVFGRVIEARAVIDDAALYSYYTPGSGLSVAAGAVRELTVLHQPWIESPGDLDPSADAVVPTLLRAAAGGLPTWSGMLVVAVVLVGALGLFRRRVAGTTTTEAAATETAVMGATAADTTATEAASAVSRRPGGAWPALRLLAACTLLTLVLYPPALRLANVLNFGIDHPIVSRYSVAFAPLLCLLAAVFVPGRVLPRLLAVAGVVTIVGLSVAWL